MDALRGVAALSIVAGHAYNSLHTQPAEHGYLDNLAEGLAVGVPVFFALSGFLLFRPYLAALNAGHPLPSMRSFFRRRALRILPAYWVALTVCGLLLPDSAPGVFGDRWWVFYLFGQAYSLTDNFDGLAVAWTLSVEVSFYLVLPMLGGLVAVAARWIGWRRSAWLLVGLLIVLGLSVRVLNTIGFEDRGAVVAIQRIVYGLPGEAGFFAVGMALAIVSVGGPTPRLAGRPSLTWALACGVFLLTAAWFAFTHPYGGLDFRTRFVASHVLAMAFTALVLLPAAFEGHRGVPRAVLRWPPLVFTGVVSYGLYLWHVPLEGWLLGNVLGGVQESAFAPRIAVTFAVVLAASLAIAAVRYYVVELPFLRLKDRRARPGSARRSGRARHRLPTGDRFR